MIPRSRIPALLIALSACGLLAAANGDSPSPPVSPGSGGEAKAAVPAAGAFDHSEWDRLLKTYVDAKGLVAYRDLAAKDRPALDRYLAAIASADASKMEEKAALAFYINAYNAAVFKGVLDGGTAESLLGRASFFKMKKYTVAGKSLTLDDLEQKVIRPTFRDARIHFALVCASASCPALARDAWTAGNLEEMLEAEGRRFMADRVRNPLGPGPKIRVSMIFKWYEEDFVADAGSVQAFIARYAGGAGPACLRTSACVLDHVDYDWTLNAQPGQRP